MPAGSQPGERRGGRQKGTPNKRTTITHEEIRAGGEMPLERLLKRMRDPKVDDHVRDDLAVKAAPYCHPRLTSTEVSNKDGDALELNVNVTPREMARTVLDILREAQVEEK